MRLDRWMSPRTIRFGVWKAYRDSRELVGPAGTKVMDPDVMERLFLLPRNAETGISRAQIYEQLWPRGGTAPNALARCISQLRQALHDDPDARGYVLTYFERGGPEPRHTWLRLWTSYTVLKSSSRGDFDPDLVAMQVPERLGPLVWLGVCAVGCLKMLLWFIRP